ncbi:right-handed parallel beta-helix repeat-containing protein [Aneurinibacillus thermoaerophilus]|uniref:right-handed parallel beta-helix repeat-containing protein n=1 Tax=Aneurinibacillus thermoaerophilus TaxID=143495 RepID=UPI002E1B0030|nr:right-handed parallel beta-helix repeat-containing protein [Aneurinibacillus thermoaerophilus]MED0762826.1 right-handed parallel beta-helix repeat-containing protein [Aneurinibacillus thermoaerophilus]
MNELSHKLIKGLIFICIFSFLSNQEGSANERGSPDNLQNLIRLAKPGETLLIQAGDYKGPIIIDKPLHLKVVNGKVRIRNESKQPAIQIKADHSRLTGIEIVDSLSKESAAIVITGNDNILENLAIQTKSSGIQLSNASHNTIRETRIIWLEQKDEPPAKMSQKGNGIDLWKSHQNNIIENTVVNLHDGIYLENSNLNQVESNRIDYSRYGIHCMYTNGTIIRHNVGSYNVTGAMIMGAKNTQVIGNTFYKQSENVNSQGLLLYDVQTSIIERNRLEGNRVGMYVEQSQNNDLRNNVIHQNFIGLQLKNAQQNTCHSNLFYANVIQAEGIDSRNNQLKENYWDNFQGIDMANTGHSSIPYAINPFFQKLTEAVPAYQLFFQSPGMFFLESMFMTNQDSWTKDTSPLIRPPLTTDIHRSLQSKNTLWMGVFLFVASISTIFYLGVRRI